MPDKPSAFARALFHWRFANWAIAILVGAAMSAAYEGHFFLAYLCTALATIYAVGCWLYSDTIARKRAENTYVIYVASDTRRTNVTPKFRRWQLIPLLVLLAICTAVCLAIHQLSVEKELLSLNGVLFPANDPIPNNPCRITSPSNDLMFLTGSGSGAVAVKTWGDHMKIITLFQKAPEPNITFLSIDRGKSGSVTVNAQVFDDEGKAIVQIDENHFFINRNAILDSLSPPRPNESTILIRDQHGGVLKIQLMNSNTLLFQGKFHVGERYVEFANDGIFKGPPRSPWINGPCLDMNGNSGSVLGLQ